MENFGDYIREKCLDFAVDVVNTYKHLCEDKKEYVLSKQLLRSGTSIGANLVEAQNGISHRDFVAKISISHSLPLIDPRSPAHLRWDDMSGATPN